MAGRDERATEAVTLNWPGKPTCSGVFTPSDLRLAVREVWPGDPLTTPAAAPATLIAADAATVMGSWDANAGLIPAGPVRLIYLDPPFATGTTFTVERPIGERGPGQPTLRLPAYRDVWSGGLPGYLTFMFGLLATLRTVLADDGWLCLHCDHRTSAHLRLILDELFGPGAFRNEIVWSYGLGNGTSRRGFPRKHDTLLLYAKSGAARFTPVRGAVSPAMANKYRHVRPDGTRFMRSYGREYDLKGGKPVGSVWPIPSVAPTSTERTDYPTQKPLALLERLISATTAPGDLVLDPCCGSGTTLLAATKLGRPAIGIDASMLAIAASRSRLVRHGTDLRVLAPAADRGTALQVGGPPAGGVATAPPRLYQLAARAIRSGDAPGTAGESLSLALEGLAVSGIETTSPETPFAIRDAQLVRRDAPLTPLTQRWTDWLDGWAIHLGGDCSQPVSPFIATAATMRSGRSRTLPTTLTIADLPDGELTTVTIRLYDVFGATSDHVMPVTRD